MKRRVRIYQQGGQNKRPSVTENILLGVQQALSQGMDRESIMEMLVSQGYDTNLANDIVSSAETSLGESAKENNTIDQEMPVEEVQDTPYDYSTNFAPEQEDGEEEFMRYGGQKKMSKRKFSSLIMKQLGGEEGADDTDTMNGRESINNGFISGLKNNSNKAILKQFIDQQYEMMQEGGNIMEEDVENPLHHLQLYSQMSGHTFSDPTVGTDDEFQFGGMNRRMMRRANRMMRNMPFFPGAFPTGPIQNIDIQRVGLFGRPKEYQINFGYLPGQYQFPTQVLPQGNQTYITSAIDEPGVPVETTAVTGKQEVEQTAAQVNTTEAEKANPTEVVTEKVPASGSSAVTKSGTAGKKSAVVKKQTTAQTLQENIDEENVDSRAGVSAAAGSALHKFVDPFALGQWQGVEYPYADGVTKSVIVLKKDKWGRPEGSKWYGFDPKTNKWTLGNPNSYTNSAKKVLNTVGKNVNNIVQPEKITKGALALNQAGISGVKDMGLQMLSYINPQLKKLQDTQKLLLNSQGAIKPFVKQSVENIDEGLNVIGKKGLKVADKVNASTDEYVNSTLNNAGRGFKDLQNQYLYTDYEYGGSLPEYQSQGETYGYENIPYYTPYYNPGFRNSFFGQLLGSSPIKRTEYWQPSINGLPSNAPLSSIYIKPGLFGRPKRITYNFGQNQMQPQGPAMGTKDAPFTINDQEPVAYNKSNRNSLPEKMLKVPGLRKLGARLLQGNGDFYQDPDEKPMTTEEQLELLRSNIREPEPLAPDTEKWNQEAFADLESEDLRIKALDPFIRGNQELSMPEGFNVNQNFPSGYTPMQPILKSSVEAPSGYSYLGINEQGSPMYSSQNLNYKNPNSQWGPSLETETEPEPSPKVSRYDPIYDQPAEWTGTNDQVLEERMRNNQQFFPTVDGFQPYSYEEERYNYNYVNPLSKVKPKAKPKVNINRNNAKPPVNNAPVNNNPVQQPVKPVVNNNTPSKTYANQVKAEKRKPNYVQVDAPENVPGITSQRRTQEQKEKILKANENMKRSKGAPSYMTPEIEKMKKTHNYNPQTGLWEPKWQKRKYGGILEKYQEGNETQEPFQSNNWFEWNSGTEMPTNPYEQPKTWVVDPQQVNQSAPTSNPFGDPYSITAKRKNMWEINYPDLLNAVNTGLGSGIGMLNRFRDRERERDMYNEFNADSLYAEDSYNKGQVDTNSGLRFQYGGYMEDEEIEMTEEELEEFLNNGGEVEFL